MIASAAPPKTNCTQSPTLNDNNSCSLAALLQSKLASPSSVCLVTDNARRPSDSLLEQALLVMKDFDMGDECEDGDDEASSEPSDAPLSRRRPNVSKEVKKGSSPCSSDLKEKRRQRRMDLVNADLPGARNTATSPPTSSCTRPVSQASSASSVSRREMLCDVLETTLSISHRSHLDL